MAQKVQIPEHLRRQVREQARGRCEYRLLHDEDAILSHEVDHIIAEKHGGPTALDNLAWACAACNRFKGTDFGSMDPATSKLVHLFHPRRQQWHRHFRLIGPRIEPLTASGRATERLLHLNDEARIQDRLALSSIGHYPRE